MNYASDIRLSLFEKRMFSAKGAAFNAKPGASPQDLWFPRHQR